MSCTCQGRLAVRRRDDHPGVMSVSAEAIGSGPSADEERPAGRRVRAGARLRRRLPVLVAGALPVLAFPRPGLDWLAWVALMPGLLLARSAPDGREAAKRGWWFGGGFIVAALYWLVPALGPGPPAPRPARARRPRPGGGAGAGAPPPRRAAGPPGARSPPPPPPPR